MPDLRLMVRKQQWSAFCHFLSRWYARFFCSRKWNLIFSQCLYCNIGTETVFSLRLVCRRGVWAAVSQFGAIERRAHEQLWHRTHASPSSSNSKELRYSTNSQTGIVCHEDRLQSAFKVLMIHRILRFTLVIAICCVLHRCKSQDIHCQKLSDKFIILSMRLKLVDYSCWFAQAKLEAGTRK